MTLVKKTVQLQKMRQEKITQIPFKQAGKTDNQITPEKSADRNTQGKPQNDGRIIQKPGLGDGAAAEAVHRLFNYPWDPELQEINPEKGCQTEKQTQTVFAEIGRQQDKNLRK
jgi:hypothetical protein